VKLSKRIIGFVVCVGIVMLGLAPAQAQGNGKRLVLNLVGMDETYIKSISDPDNDGQSVDAFVTMSIYSMPKMANVSVQPQIAFPILQTLHLLVARR
jgi:hypothetical protein